MAESLRRIGRIPSLSDLRAVTERKPTPAPTDMIVIDPQTDAQYNAAVESWDDRVSAAGGRLCPFFEGIHMWEVDLCPPAPAA